MKIETIPGARKAARRAAGQYQRTFRTPLGRLQAFTTLILSSNVPIKSGYVLVDAVIAEPTHVGALLTSSNLAATCQGRTITANSIQECGALLLAALSDSIDFYFVPNPKRFVLYADHDEYTTVYAHSKGPLSQMATAIADAGFQEITDFARSL
jgi:hypothetical protein